MRHGVHHAIVQCVGLIVGGLLMLWVGTDSSAQPDVPEVVRERLDEGDRHRAAGRLDEAIESYLEARRLGPSVLETYTSLGALYTGQDELEKALEAFSSGLERMPDDRQLLYNVAVIALRLDLLEQALSAVEHAVAKHRGDADLYSLHGAILSRLDRPDEALAALEMAAKRKPGDSQILFRLGNLQHQVGQPQSAIDTYRKAIKKDRTMLRAYYNLGAVLLESGQFDAALDAYKVALEPLEAAFTNGQTVEVIHAQAFQNLGAIYFQKKAWQSALDAYSKALRLDPQLTAALYNQGFIYYTLGQFEAAESTYREALKLDRELPIAYLHLGLIEQGRGEHEAAVRWLTDGLLLLDGSSRQMAYCALAESQDELGRSAEAETAFRSLLELAPEDLSARLDLGRLLRRAGELVAARQELEKVRSAAPDPLEAMMELASLAKAEGKTGEEKALYQDMLRRAGSRPGMWPIRLNLALVHLQQGDVKQAKPHLESLVGRKTFRGERAPGVEERQLIATIHGLLLALDGDVPAGRQRVQAVLAEDAGFIAALDIAAVLEAAAGELEAGQAMTASWERQQGSALEALTRANLGQILWLSGRSDAARPHLDAAIEAYPQWLSLRVARAEIAVAAKRYAEAVSDFQAAVGLCGTEGASTFADAPAVEGVFQTTLGLNGDPSFCARANRGLASARLGVAFEGLRPALGDGQLGNGRLATGRLATILRLVDAALGGELDQVSRAVAHYVRGTARIADGADEPARQDFTVALQGPLPRALRSLAYNNLGVAHSRLGNVTAAQEAFETARREQRPSPESTLNLGILFDDHTDQPQQAIELYRQYLSLGGARQSDVAAWVERLERIY